MAGAPSSPANSASSLASGSLQAQPAPGDSEVRRGAWMGSAVTVATVAGPWGSTAYQAAVAIVGDHGIGVYVFPWKIPMLLPFATSDTTRTLPDALVHRISE